MLRRVILGSLIFMVFAVIGLYIYGAKVEDKTMVLTVEYAAVNPYSGIKNVVRFLTSDGSRMLIDRIEFKGDLNMWDSLSEGQKISFHHHIAYWDLLGNVIVKSHRDSLSRVD